MCLPTGQAYVALSRATSLSGLQVLNFNPSKVGTHRRQGVYRPSDSRDLFY